MILATDEDIIMVVGALMRDYRSKSMGWRKTQEGSELPSEIKLSSCHDSAWKIV